jgi:outer membrane biosynthesis protein TonB
MRRWPLWLKILPVAVLLLLFVLLALLATRAGPQPTTVTVVLTPTPTPVVLVIQVTATPAPTPTPLPATATPMPPTPTPVVVVVTATPAPTTPPPPPPAPPPPTPAPPAPTPATKPGPSPELAAYLAAVQPRLQAVAEATRLLAEQTNRLASTPAALGDPTWRAQTATVLTTMRATGAELQASAQVPEAAASLDASLQAIGRDLVSVADEYGTGVQAQDPARINSAGRRLEALSTRTQQATLQFNALAQGG